MYTPVNPSFALKKVGFKGVKIIKACFRYDQKTHFHDAAYRLFSKHPSRKYTYIILTPLNPQMFI